MLKCDTGPFIVQLPARIFPLMNTARNDLAQAVITWDLEETKRCLAEGESPNVMYGSFPLITHAARLHQPVIFKLLLDNGAEVPDSLLSDVITWELGDWILQNDKEIEELVAILKMIRHTTAWSSLDDRRSLAARLDSYGLEKVVTALLAP